MRFASVFAGLLCAGLLPSLAQAQSAAALEIMEELAEGGCVVTQDREAEFLAAIEARGLTANAVGDELLNAGLIQLAGNSLVITGGSCADQVADLPEASPSLVATMTAIRDNGCMISEVQADDLLEPLGPRAEIMGHLATLDELHFVRIIGDLGGVVASDRVCNATDPTLVRFASQVPDMLELGRLNRLDFIVNLTGARVLMLEAVVGRECQALTDDLLRGLFDLELEDPFASVETPLVDAGLIELVGQVFVAPEAVCAATAAERREMVAALP
ncbi:hypothetical protein [Gymnodinialimonas sp.]